MQARYESREGMQGVLCQLHRDGVKALFCGPKHSRFFRHDDADSASAQAPHLDHHGVAQHRDYLYRYALLHLRDANRAEDVVQETLLAAVESGDRFSGRSSLRTWLTGILKHKIIDVFRKQSREAPVESSGAGWRVGPWSSRPLLRPAACRSLAHLPPYLGRSGAHAGRQALLGGLRPVQQADAAADRRAFYLRELMGLETDEILQGTEHYRDQLRVMLYRARMSLRQCLAVRWFGGSRPSNT